MIFIKKEARWKIEELNEGYINYDHSSPISTVETEVLKKIMKQTIENEVDYLEPIFRMVIILIYVAELTDEEIANTLDIRIGTVKSHDCTQQIN